MEQSRVTIVLATYNRPEVLRYAIRSVLRQQFEAWKLLVVGDCCDARTATAVAEFADPRIAYVNLPERCGEQAIPNSIGMALAETEYVALLNHDDIWLRCHLGRAVATLDGGDAEWFISRAAFACAALVNPDGGVRPVITETNPPDRQLAEAFYKAQDYLEPCSTWVFRRSLYERVGLWPSGLRVYRTALNHWALHAWRLGVKTHFAEPISTIKGCLHQHRLRANYRSGDAGFANLEERLGQLDADAALPCIDEDLALAAAKGTLPRDPGIIEFPNASPAHRKLASELISKATSEVFLATGWDAFAQYCILTGLDRGYRLRELLCVRTGETPAEPPDFGRLLVAARRQLDRA